MYKEGLNEFYNDINIEGEMNALNNQLNVILKNHKEGKYNLHAGETYAPWWHTTAKNVRNVTLTGAALLDLAWVFSKTGQIPKFETIKVALEKFEIPAYLIKKFAEIYNNAEKLSQSEKIQFWEKISEAGKMAMDFNFLEKNNYKMDPVNFSLNLDNASTVLNNMPKSISAT